MRGHGGATQVIAIGKAAGNDQQIRFGQLAVAVPDLERRLARRSGQRIKDVLLAVGAGKNDDGGLHRSAASRGDRDAARAPSSLRLPAPLRPSSTRYPPRSLRLSLWPPH